MATPEPRADGAPSPLDLSPGREQRVTSTSDADDAGRPLKQHGDALLDGSGSRQGRDPDPELDAAPHE